MFFLIFVIANLHLLIFFVTVAPFLNFLEVEYLTSYPLAFFTANKGINVM